MIKHPAITSATILNTALTVVITLGITLCLAITALSVYGLTTLI